MFLENKNAAHRGYLFQSSNGDIKIMQADKCRIKFPICSVLKTSTSVVYCILVHNALEVSSKESLFLYNFSKTWPQTKVYLWGHFDPSREKSWKLEELAYLWPYTVQEMYIPTACVCFLQIYSQVFRDDKLGMHEKAFSLNFTALVWVAPVSDFSSEVSIMAKMFA